MHILRKEFQDFKKWVKGVKKKVEEKIQSICKILDTLDRRRRGLVDLVMVSKICKLFELGLQDDLAWRLHRLVDEFSNL